MPGTKSASNKKPQRSRQDSRRKREAKAQESAEGRARKEQKDRVKERRQRRQEEEEEALLVEREGESPEYRKLREQNMKLATELERMQARLNKTEKKDAEVPLVKAPAKGAIKVEKIREHLGLLDAAGDAKWSDIRRAVRRHMFGAHLNWDLPFSRQKPERLCMAYNSVEKEVPALQQFENHWVAEYLMKESFQNHRTHSSSKEPADASDDDQLPKKPTKPAKPTLKPSKPSKPSNVTKHLSNKEANDEDGDDAHENSDDNHENSDDNHENSDDNHENGKKDGDKDIEDKDPSPPDSNVTNASGPYNDGETEIEDGNRDAGEDMEDAGYKGKGKAPAKTLAKKDRVRLQRTDSEVIPRPVTKKPKRQASPPSDEPSFASASTSTTKKRPVIPTAKRGRGGRGGRGGKGGRVSEGSSRAVQLGTDSASESESQPEPDDVELSDTSGQTSSASEE